MSDRKMINLNPVPAAILKARKDKINKAREKVNKRPLDNGEIIEIALTNLTVEMGLK